MLEPSITGYLLQRQWRDTDQGLRYTLWVQTPEGPGRLQLHQQQAVCFVPRDVPVGAGADERRASQLCGPDGAVVDALYFRQQRQLEEWLSREDHRSMAFEADIKPVERFLMERFIQGGVQVQGQWYRRDGLLCCDDPKIKAAEVHPTLRLLSLDIETGGGEGEPLYSIGLSGPGLSRVYMARAAPVELNKKSDTVVWCDDERGALEAALACIAEYDPDLLIGWNIVGFDLRFLATTCQRLGMPFTLGRGGERAQILPPGAGGVAVARVPGRVVLDGVALLKAAFYKFDSFALGNVATELLGERKLIETQGMAKVREIQRQFRTDPLALAHYNLQDCELVERIFAKAQLVDFAVARSSMTGLPLDRLGGSVAAFEYLYLPRLHRKGKVALSMAQLADGENSPGGYVLDSVPGRFANVLLFDFKSLYPSIIRSFLIDPAGLCEENPHSVPGFRGAHFSRDTPILPTLIEELWAKRDAAKRDNNQPLSQAIKIIMNSFYGVLGSSGCRFFDPRLASSITLRGHQIIHDTKSWFENNGQRVIYGDTDSLFVAMDESLSLDECQVRGEALCTALNDYWRARLRDEFDLQSHLEIEFETLFSQFWMPHIRGSEQGSKKRYAGRVQHADGPELVVKGLESVRSDWTPLAQHFQRSLLNAWFDGADLSPICRDTHAALMAGELDDQLVFRKRIRRPLDSYQRNVPPHIQAARKLPSPGRDIAYVHTLNGPEPVENLTAAPDHELYAERQLAPIADAILYHEEQTFAALVDQQLGLF